MVWTETSWLLALVAVFVVVVALLAILLQEVRAKPSLSRVSHRLSDDADLTDEERRYAMRHFDPSRTHEATAEKR